MVAMASARERPTWREDIVADLAAVSSVLSEASDLALSPIDVREWDPPGGTEMVLPSLAGYTARAFPGSDEGPVLVLADRPEDWRVSASRGRMAFRAPLEGAEVWPFFGVAALYGYWDHDELSRRATLCQTVTYMHGGFRDREPECVMNPGTAPGSPLRLCQTTAQVVREARDILWAKGIAGLGPPSAARIQALFYDHGLPGDTSPIVAGWYNGALATELWEVLDRAVCTDPMHPNPLVVAEFALHRAPCTEAGYYWARVADESYGGADPMTRAVLKSARGNLAALTGRFDEALTCWRAAVAADAPLYFSQFYEDEAFLRAGSLADLKALVARALETAGTQEPTIAIVRARALGTEGDIHQALAVIEKARANAPHDQRLPLIAAAVHLEAGRPELARVELLRAGDLDPVWSDTHAFWVLHADALGTSSAEIASHARDYLRFAPNGVHAAAMRAALERLGESVGGN